MNSMEKGYKCKKCDRAGFKRTGLKRHDEKMHPLSPQEKDKAVLVASLSLKWVAWNYKTITGDSFRIESQKCGFDFSPDDFFKVYPTEAMQAIRDYRKMLREEEANAKAIEARNRDKKRQRDCICAAEEKKSSNATQGREKKPIRLWTCPAHGNRACDITNKE